MNNQNEAVNANAEGKTAVKKFFMRAGITLLSVILVFGIWQLIIPRESSLAFVKNLLFNGEVSDAEKARVDKYVAEAYTMIEAQKYDNAIEVMTKAIKLDANDYEPYLMRGYAYTYKFDFDSAYKDYSKALELAPKNDTVYEAIADLRFNTQDFKSATEYYSKCINLNPDNRRAVEKRIMSCIEDEDYKTAIDYCTTLYNENQADVVASATLGDCYTHLKEYDKALDYYNIALTACQSTGDTANLIKVYLSLGTCYLMTEDYATAIQYLTEYIDSAEKNASSENKISLDAYVNRGIAYFYRKDYDNTIKDMTVAINGNQQLAKASLYRGLSYKIKYYFEEAVKDLKVYFDSNPENGEVYYSDMAAAYISLGESAEAEKWYKKCIDANVDTDEANYCLGFIYFNDNKFKEAGEYFTKCIDKKYKLDFSLYNRGMCYYNLEDYKNMYNDLVKMVDIATDKDMKTDAQAIIKAVKEQGLLNN